MIAINLAALLPSLANEFGLADVFLRPLTQRVLQPGIKAAGVDAQAATHRPHWEQWTMLGNESVLHFAYLAKYAAAFIGFRAPRWPCQLTLQSPDLGVLVVAARWP